MWKCICGFSIPSVFLFLLSSVSWHSHKLSRTLDDRPFLFEQSKTTKTMVAHRVPSRRRLQMVLSRLNIQMNAFQCCAVFRPRGTQNYGDGLLLANGRTDCWRR